MSKPESFNEWWATKAIVNPNLLEDKTMKMDTDVFKNELAKAFQAGTQIPMELARDSVVGPKTEMGAVLMAAGKVYEILVEYGIDDRTVSPTNWVGQVIQEYITGKMTEEKFRQIMKASKQKLS